MFFFFKKKTVYLDCYTYHPQAYEYNKIDRAVKFMPEWWKQLPREYFYSEDQNLAPQSTMKRCEGLLSLYREGFILPLWTDMVILSSPENEPIRWQMADRISSMDFHDDRQYSGLVNLKEYRQAKLHSPWMFTCDEDIKFACSQPSYNWNYFGDLHVLPGIFGFKYQFSTNVNFLIKREYKRIILEAGQPLLWLGPMTDKEVKLRHHLISREDFNKNIARGALAYKFTKGYRTNKENGVCPVKITKTS